MLPNGRPASALPSVGARVLAFVAIIVAGLAGAAIGGSVVNIECHGSCGTPIGIGAVVGGAGAAGGTGVVAALTLRAMGEWKRISEEELAGGPAEAGEGGSSTGDGPPPGGDPSSGGEGGPDQDGVSSRKPSA